MKILLTNDDGLDAPGLRLLRDIAGGFAETVTIAPTGEVSECGHRVTTKRDLVLGEHEARRFSLDGAPVDCVRIGLRELCPEVDWVLAGVNNGANLGADLFISGTAAAAREAALLGRPAIALSQYRRGEVPERWRNLAGPLERLLSSLLRRRPKPGAFWNVNFPAAEDLQPTTAVSECPLERHPLPIRYEVHGNRFRYSAVYADRERTPGSDIDICLTGGITITHVPIFPS